MVYFNKNKVWCLVLNLFCKYENKQKRPGNGPILKKTSIAILYERESFGHFECLTFLQFRLFECRKFSSDCWPGSATFPRPGTRPTRWPTALTTLFFKNGPIQAFFVFITFQFKWQIYNMNNISWKKHRCCSWESNPGWQDGRCEWIHWAIF